MCEPSACSTDGKGSAIVKQCTQCMKRIDTQARVCPYCHTEFTKDEIATATKFSRIRGAVGLAIIIAIGAGIVKSCGL